MIANGAVDQRAISSAPHEHHRYRGNDRTSKRKRLKHHTEPSEDLAASVQRGYEIAAILRRSMLLPCQICHAQTRHATEYGSGTPTHQFGAVWSSGSLVAAVCRSVPSAPTDHDRCRCLNYRRGERMLKPHADQVPHSCKLSAARQHVVTYQELVQQEQGYAAESYAAADLIKPHIYHLRQKLDANPSDPRYILTVRGTG